MTGAIDVLTDDQARQAVKLLFDFIPESAFEGGRKPSAERIRTVTGALRDQAPFNDRPVIQGLLLAERPEQAAAQAEIARIVLRQAYQSSALAPAVARAINVASRPQMAIDPVTGAVMVALLLATTHFEKKEDGYKVELGAGAKDIIGALRVPELLDKLPALVKALPSAVVAKLLHLG